MKVLSTKNLTAAQRERIVNAGLEIVMYDAIRVEHVPFNPPKPGNMTIFTSQNGVRGCIAQLGEDYFKSTPIEVFCVGEKTTALIEKLGGNVIKTAQNATELGHFLVKNYKNGGFLYFCGNLRRPELPNILQSQQISFTEVITYKTKLNTKEFEQKWDAILFFSPSGIESYNQQNKLNDAKAICIGETTANAAKKYTNNIVVANQTTIDSVVAKTVTTLKKLKI